MTNELLSRLRQLSGWQAATDRLRERYQADGDAARRDATGYAERYQGRRGYGVRRGAQPAAAVQQGRAAGRAVRRHGAGVEPGGAGRRWTGRRPSAAGW